MSRQCAVCGAIGCQIDFGANQFKWTNPRPTCLACAWNTSQVKYKTQSTRTCVECAQAGGKTFFGAKQFKWGNPRPTCLACAAERRLKDYDSWVASQGTSSSSVGPVLSAWRAEQVSSSASAVCAVCGMVHEGGVSFQDGCYYTPAEWLAHRAEVWHSSSEQFF